MVSFTDFSRIQFFFFFWLFIAVSLPVCKYFVWVVSRLIGDVLAGFLLIKMDYLKWSKQQLALVIIVCYSVKMPLAESNRMCTKIWKQKCNRTTNSVIETVIHLIYTRDLLLSRILCPFFRSVIHLKRPIVVFHTSRWGFWHFAEFWYFLSGALVDIIFLSRYFTHTHIHTHKHTKDTPWISQFEEKHAKRKRTIAIFIALTWNQCFHPEKFKETHFTPVASCCCSGSILLNLVMLNTLHTQLKISI